MKSDAILGVPPKQAKASGQSTRTLNPPRTRNPPSVPPEEGNMEHAHMLASVWMNATKLSEMAKEQGTSTALIFEPEFNVRHCRSCVQEGQVFDD